MATEPVQFLLDQHEKVRGLFKQYESLLSSSTGEGKDKPADLKDQKLKLAKEIVQNLQVHEQLEEEIFYPFFKQTSSDDADKKLIDESLLEHHSVDILVKDLLTQTDPNETEFDDLMKKMHSNLEEHLTKEESGIFPKARDILGDRAPGLLDSLLKLRDKLLEELKSPGTSLEEKAEEKAGTLKSIPDEKGAPTESTPVDSGAAAAAQEEAVAKEDAGTKAEPEAKTTDAGAATESAEKPAEETTVGQKHAATEAGSAKQPKAKRARQR